MKTTEQKVEMYWNLSIVRDKMTKEIEDGWRVYTCTSCNSGLADCVLVVYEKDLEAWN